MTTARGKRLGGKSGGAVGQFAPPKSNARPAWVSKALKLQARGHDYDSIALILDLSVQTVKAHIDPRTITVANVKERNDRVRPKAVKDAEQAAKRDDWRARKRAQRAAQYLKPKQEN
jgi:hypothetical protein